MRGVVAALAFGGAPFVGGHVEPPVAGVLHLQQQRPRRFARSSGQPAEHVYDGPVPAAAGRWRLGPWTTYAGSARREGPLKRVWLEEDIDVTGSMVSSWEQSWGVSRDERTRKWVLYDRRDSRSIDPGEGVVSQMTETYHTPHALAEALIDGEAGYKPKALLELVTRHDHPAMKELADVVRGYSKTPA